MSTIADTLLMYYDHSVVLVGMKQKEMHCRLAVLMAEKNPRLSQKQLSRETKLATTTLNRLFNNTFKQVDRVTVNTLLTYFSCKVEDLFATREVDDY